MSRSSLRRLSIALRISVRDRSSIPLAEESASRVRLASAALPGNRFRVAVADDGAPFNAASAEPRPGHFGLVDIRERAERNRFALRSGRARGLQELTIEGEASK